MLHSSEAFPFSPTGKSSHDYFREEQERDLQVPLPRSVSEFTNLFYVCDVFVKLSSLDYEEGVCYAKKDYNLAKHPLIDVPNLQVIKLMQSFKSKEYVRETFAWMHYYWYLTNDGIEFLRTYLNLPSEIVPATLKKSAKPLGRPMGGPPGDRPRGPPRFGDGERRFGDRDGYRGGPRGPPGEFGGEKGGAPADYQPAFRVIPLSFILCN
nr:40S ribosomal protein S10-1-like [Ipomoea batatas]